VGAPFRSRSSHFTGSSPPVHQPPDLTPLEEIEQRVQARAKDTVLDMGAPDGAARLRGLIDDEVARWSDDHRRGRRDFDLAEPTAVAERAWRNLAGYGPLAPLLG
jgi:hypothetical protein